MDWTAIGSAAAAAVIVTIVALRWGTRSRSRDIHIEFDWHSKARDDSTSTKADDQP